MERKGLSGFELLVVVGAALVGVVGGAVWLGAWLAAAATHSRLHATLGDAVVAATRLPSHLSNPKLAWSAEHHPVLPGPLLYWSVTAVVSLVAAATAIVVWRLMDRSRVGTMPRRPLGGAGAKIRG